jgi:hypothetical protein
VNARLEAVAGLVSGRGREFTNADMKQARNFLDLYDAARQFDHQRASEVEAPSVDPPWLDGAAEASYLAWFGPYRPVWADCTLKEKWREQTRAVLAFAARQPCEITDAMVEAAASVISSHTRMHFSDENRIYRAALEAAEKARTK